MQQLYPQSPIQSQTQQPASALPVMPQIPPMQSMQSMQHGTPANPYTQVHFKDRKQMMQERIAFHTAQIEYLKRCLEIEDMEQKAQGDLETKIDAVQVQVNRVETMVMNQKSQTK